MNETEKLIEQANKIYEYSSNGLEEPSKIKIVDTGDAVNKLSDGTSNDKDKLIGALIMNENKLNKKGLYLHHPY